jgi:hypothetical protein
MNVFLLLGNVSNVAGIILIMMVKIMSIKMTTADVFGGVDA